MAVLVTGGTGFVGLAVAEALVQAGREPVLFAPDGVPPTFAAMPALRGVRAVRGDVRSVADVARAFDGVDAVVHLAAVTPGPAREAGDPASVADVNLTGTLTVVRAAAAAGVTRIVTLSSVAVYGDAAPGPDGRLHECACPRPQSLYGITKLAAEQAALRLGALHGLDVRAVRLGPVFGPWERASGMRDILSPHAQALAAAGEGAPVVLSRPLAADWIYARDAGTGIAAVLEAPSSEHRVFNLGGGTVTTVADWCAALAANGVAIDWRLAGPGEAANVTISLARDRAALSTARIEAAKGFRHRFDLAAAAADHLAWLRQTKESAR